jgi:hypothetical protein
MSCKTMNSSQYRIVAELNALKRRQAGIAA